MIVEFRVRHAGGASEEAFVLRGEMVPIPRKGEYVRYEEDEWHVEKVKHHYSNDNSESVEVQLTCIGSNFDCEYGCGIDNHPNAELFGLGR